MEGGITSPDREKDLHEKNQKCPQAQQARPMSLWGDSRSLTRKKAKEVAVWMLREECAKLAVKSNPHGADLFTCPSAFTTELTATKRHRHIPSSKLIFFIWASSSASDHRSAGQQVADLPCPSWDTEHPSYSLGVTQPQSHWHLSCFSHLLT